MPHGSGLGADPSETLNAITAPDNYSDLYSIQGTPIHHFNIDVNNGAIYWQLQKAAYGATGTWESTEVYMTPGSRSIYRAGVTGIRVRAAIPAASLPAGQLQSVVTIEAVKQ